jgi:murein DD-endopeptidase MepM/ murein hydrolase activator NlpD
MDVKIPNVAAGRLATEFDPTTHRGIDIALALGTPVGAYEDALVDFAGWDPSGGGNEIRLQAGLSDVIKYFHLSSFAVNQGDRVKAGQTIGYSGSTGRSTGPHLHLEIWQPDGLGKLVAVDPRTAVPTNAPAYGDQASPYNDQNWDAQTDSIPVLPDIPSDNPGDSGASSGGGLLKVLAALAALKLFGLI